MGGWVVIEYQFFSLEFSESKGQKYLAGYYAKQREKARGLSPDFQQKAAEITRDSPRSGTVPAA